MKNFKKVVLTFLLIGGVFFLAACNTTTSATTENQAETLDQYIAQIGDYVEQFAASGMGSRTQLAAMQFQADITGFSYNPEISFEDNKAIVEDLFQTAMSGIALGFVPGFSEDADISEYLYQSGIFKFNDLLSTMVGELSMSWGGGRASYTAGAITDESRPAVFTYEEIQKILALEDEGLKERMLAVCDVSEIFQSIVVSFIFDNRFVMTNHYTDLGVEYLNALGGNVEINREYYVFGTYDLAEDPFLGTNEYDFNVILEDETTLEFIFNASEGTVVGKNNIFTRIPMIAVDEAPNASGGTDFPSEELIIDEDPNIVAYRDIHYGNRTMEPRNPSDEGYDPNETQDVRDNRETLSIFLPENLDTTRENGVILFIHGGSWTSGDKKDMETYCANYTKMGYITATMSHTYAGRIYSDTLKPATFLDMENEIDLAFSKIKEMSDENGWNITKAATSGYSSGSHLAAWYAYGKGNEETAPIPVVLTFSMVGILSFYQEFWYEKMMPIGPMVAVLGLNDPALFVISEENEEEIEKITSGELDRSVIDPLEYTTYDEATYRAKIDSISPISFVLNGDAVPTVAGYGMLDIMLVSSLHGIRLEEALTAQGIEHEVIMFPNSGHMMAGNAECGNVYRMLVLEYLQDYFGY